MSNGKVSISLEQLSLHIAQVDRFKPEFDVDELIVKHKIYQESFDVQEGAADEYSDIVRFIQNKKNCFLYFEEEFRIYNVVYGGKSIFDIFNIHEPVLG